MTLLFLGERKGLFYSYMSMIIFIIFIVFLATFKFKKIVLEQVFNYVAASATKQSLIKQALFSMVWVSKETLAEY